MANFQFDTSYRSMSIGHSKFKVCWPPWNSRNPRASRRTLLRCSLPNWEPQKSNFTKICKKAEIQVQARDVLKKVTVSIFAFMTAIGHRRSALRLARGLREFQGVQHTLNFECPMDIEWYEVANWKLALFKENFEFGGDPNLSKL